MGCKLFFISALTAAVWMKPFLFHILPVINPLTWRRREKLRSTIDSSCVEGDFLLLTFDKSECWWFRKWVTEGTIISTVILRCSPIKICYGLLDHKLLKSMVYVFISRLGSDCQHQKSILVILREKGNVLKE
jgi:hypothetical protein